MHHVGGPGADVGGHLGEDQPGGVLGGGGLDLGRAVALDDRPGDEAVEDAEEGHGYVGGARDGPARVAGLRAVDRGGLEAHEGGEGEDHQRAGAAVEHVLRRVGLQVQAVGAALEQDRGGEHHQDARLGDHQHGQQLGAELDAAVPGEPDQGDPGQGVDRPGDVHAEERLHRALRHAAEQPVHADLHRVVGHQREDGGGHAGRSAQASGDVGVERAGVGHIPGHRGETDREDGQHDPGDQVRGRRTDAADQDRVGGDPGQDHQGSGSGDDEERDVTGPERPAAQLWLHGGLPWFRGGRGLT